MHLCIKDTNGQLTCCDDTALIPDLPGAIAPSGFASTEHSGVGCVVSEVLIKLTAAPHTLSCGQAAVILYSYVALSRLVNPAVLYPHPAFCWIDKVGGVHWAVIAGAPGANPTHSEPRATSKRSARNRYKSARNGAVRKQPKYVPAESSAQCVAALVRHLSAMVSRRDRRAWLTLSAMPSSLGSTSGENLELLRARFESISPFEYITHRDLAVSGGWTNKARAVIDTARSWLAGIDSKLSSADNLMQVASIDVSRRRRYEKAAFCVLVALVLTTVAVIGLG